MISTDLTWFIDFLYRDERVRVPTYLPTYLPSSRCPLQKLIEMLNNNIASDPFGEEVETKFILGRYWYTCPLGDCN